MLLAVEKHKKGIQLDAYLTRKWGGNWPNKVSRSNWLLPCPKESADPEPMCTESNPHLHSQTHMTSWNSTQMLVSAPSRVLKPFHYTHLWGFYVLKGTFVLFHQSQRKILPLSGLTTVKLDSMMETFTIASLGPQELWYYCQSGLCLVSIRYHLSSSSWSSFRGECAVEED